MSWLIIIILAYFLFAFVSLGDRYLLVGPPQPKTYAFYVGILGILVLLLIPFVDFSIPDYFQIVFCFLAGALYVFALLGLFEGLEKFEASRVIPAIGGFLPIFTLALAYFFSGEFFGPKGISVFIPLVLGSILISWQPSINPVRGSRVSGKAQNPLTSNGVKISLKSLQISIITAFLLSLTFVLSKYVYLMLPFWIGFIWIRIGAFLAALFLLFSKAIRKEIFSGVSSVFSKKTGLFFILNQGIGAGAFILQNWAIALAGLAYLSIINALQGVQYLFLFIFAILFHRILKEEVSRKVILQKIIAIILIGLGLILLFL